jgi:alkyl hydroperoxide reductase subunit AhpF
MFRGGRQGWRGRLILNLSLPKIEGDSDQNDNQGHHTIDTFRVIVKDAGPAQISTAIIREDR